MFKLRLIVYLLLLVSITACTNQPVQPAQPPANLNMANPASVFCEQNGGKVILKTDASGGTAGICSFPDGSTCDEWAFFRSECKPGQPTLAPTLVPTIVQKIATLEPAGQATAAPWKTYQDEKLGYSFQYPPEAKMIFNEDPLKSISVVGPQVNGDNWPQITISHPSDRAEYRPPENANLLQWLTDHSLLGDTRKPDVSIAGTTAIHTRHDRSPQSYAYDRYFFAKSGQLYMLVIGHAGDREDWALYNRFLESFQFKLR